MLTTTIHFDRESDLPWHANSLNLAQAIGALFNGHEDPIIVTQVAQDLRFLDLPSSGPIFIRPANLSTAQWNRCKEDNKYRATLRSNLKFAA